MSLIVENINDFSLDFKKDEDKDDQETGQRSILQVWQKKKIPKIDTSRLAGGK